MVRSAGSSRHASPERGNMLEVITGGQPQSEFQQIRQHRLEYAQELKVQMEQEKERKLAQIIHDGRGFSKLVMKAPKHGRRAAPGGEPTVAWAPDPALAVRHSYDDDALHHQMTAWKQQQSGGHGDTANRGHLSVGLQQQNGRAEFLEKENQKARYGAELRQQIAEEESKKQAEKRMRAGGSDESGVPAWARASYPSAYATALETYPSQGIGYGSPGGGGGGGGGGGDPYDQIAQQVYSSPAPRMTQNHQPPSYYGGGGLETTAGQHNHGIRPQDGIERYAQDGGESSPARILSENAENEKERRIQREKEYRAELLEQMQEAKMRKMAQRREREQWEIRKEREIEAYNPWGKPGAGAPHRDENNEIVADLRGRGITYEVNAQAEADRIYSSPTHDGARPYAIEDTRGMQRDRYIQEASPPRRHTENTGAGVDDSHRLFRLENLDPQKQEEVMELAQKQTRQRQVLMEQMEENRRRKAMEAAQRQAQEDAFEAKLERDRAELAAKAQEGKTEQWSQRTPVKKDRRQSIAMADVPEAFPSVAPTALNKQAPPPQQVPSPTHMRRGSVNPPNNNPHQSPPRMRRPSESNHDEREGGDRIAGRHSVSSFTANFGEASALPRVPTRMSSDFDDLSLALKRLRSELGAEQIRVRSELSRQQHVLDGIQERRRRGDGMPLVRLPFPTSSVSRLENGGRARGSGDRNATDATALWRDDDATGMVGGDDNGGDLFQRASTVLESTLPGKSNLVFPTDTPFGDTLPRPDSMENELYDNNSKNVRDEADTALRRSEERLNQLSTIDGSRRGGGADDMDALLFAFLENKNSDTTPYQQY